MLRWSTRFRRAASLLLGVHFLQVLLLAASAVCDPRAGTGAHDVQPVVATLSAASTASADIAHQVHTAGPQHQHEAAALVAISNATPVADGAPHRAPNGAPHHAPQGAPCPMAMACTVTAIVSPVPTIATREVLVATVRVGDTATLPRSTRVAPEPPPPRA